MSEKVHVVIHIFQGVINDVIVHRDESKANEDYQKRVIEAYGELVDEQEGDDEIRLYEAEVIE